MVMIVKAQQYNSDGQDYEMCLHFDVKEQSEIADIMAELDEEMITYEDHEKIIKIEEPDKPETFWNAGGFSSSFVSLETEDGYVIDPEEQVKEWFE